MSRTGSEGGKILCNAIVMTVTQNFTKKSLMQPTLPECCKKKKAWILMLSLLYAWVCFNKKLFDLFQVYLLARWHIIHTFSHNLQQKVVLTLMFPPKSNFYTPLVGDCLKTGEVFSKSLQHAALRDICVAICYREQVAMAQGHSATPAQRELAITKPQYLTSRAWPSY